MYLHTTQYTHTHYILFFISATSNPVPDNHTSPVEVNCKDSYSETHFNFKIEWTLPSNPSLIEVNTQSCTRHGA